MTNAVPLTREELVNALAEPSEVAQGEVKRLVDHFLSADPDIQQAIHEWIVTGEMPAQPEVEGVTPQQLARTGVFSNPQAFAVLIMLRKNPPQGREFLKHPPPKW